MITKHPVLYAVLTVIALSAVCMTLFIPFSKSLAENQFNQNVQTGVIQNSNRSVVHLYFSDKNNSFLTAEKRALFHSDNPAEFGKIVINALIDGPRKGLMRTIPIGTTLKALYVTQDGTAYVDVSNTIQSSHPGGIRLELFTIFSIVNSLILNIPKLDAVKILIEGSEAMTLAGHIDLRFPFKANMLLIR